MTTAPSNSPIDLELWMDQYDLMHAKPAFLGGNPRPKAGSGLEPWELPPVGAPPNWRPSCPPTVSGLAAKRKLEKAALPTFKYASGTPVPFGDQPSPLLSRGTGSLQDLMQPESMCGKK